MGDGRKRPPAVDGYNGTRGGHYLLWSGTAYADPAIYYDLDDGIGKTTSICGSGHKNTKQQHHYSTMGIITYSS
eukprot:8973342-Pyramimonas_sp.AAC.1